MTKQRGADFDAPELAALIEGLSVTEVDALPFGVVRVDEQGVVQFYSEAEPRLSGSETQPRLGLHFFGQIAPCFDNDDYQGRIERALRHGVLDIEFSHVGDFDDPDRELTIRIQSARQGGFWIFTRRDT